MTAQKKAVAVIGCGVIGLTSAIRLLEAGYQATLFARAAPPHTTSDVAAAFWSPSVSITPGRMQQWALASHAVFQQLASEPAAGVLFTNLYELTTESNPLPHLALAGEVASVPRGVFPAPWSGFRVVAPRIDVPVYMPWLMQRFYALGGQLQMQEILTFETLREVYPLLVNCTGLGAPALTGDVMFPIRGQVIRVRKPLGLTPDIIYAEDENNVTYIIPRSQDCLLGGTYQFGNSDTQVDKEIAEGILARCAIFNPAFAQPEILEHKVGLRPGRHQVRLEAERLPNGATVIHNYGHGSIGHTLSWGCAAAVAGLVRERLGD